MKIPIPPLKQTGPDRCGSTCLRMVLAFYGMNFDDEEILKEIHKTDQDDGTYVTELAWFAAQKGLIIDCYSYNLFYLDPSDAKLSQRKLTELLKEKSLSIKKEDEYYSGMIESTIKAIEGGVKFQIKRFEIEMVRNYLTQGIPVIVTVNYATLHDKQGDPFGTHDIVINGYEDGNYFFVDPEHATEEKISEKDLEFAIISCRTVTRSAYLLAIK